MCIGNPGLDGQMTRIHATLEGQFGLGRQGQCPANLEKNLQLLEGVPIGLITPWKMIKLKRPF